MHTLQREALRLGPIAVDPPVVLAPMAGITNAAYRQLCREQGAGLYVCEMITSRAIVERIPKTFAMLRFDPGETVRSVQLYGVDPDVMAKATTILCAEFGVAHVDLNFGCPVPKVTRRGGGGALPWKRDRLAAILTATVRAAEPYGVPVTMKTRLGIDEQHGVVELHRHADGEVDGAEGLALARHRAGDHDQVGVIDARGADVGSVAQQRPLDDAEFLGDRGARLLGRDHALGGQHVEVDVHRARHRG